MNMGQMMMNKINNQVNDMMNQLKVRNPQAFNQFQELRKSNGNPQEFFNQITKGYSPEQKQQFSRFLNSFGISNEQLTQYGIKVN